MTITFWKFCAIPPQRLNIWIIKARLSSAELKLRRYFKMRDDLRFLVFYSFVTLFFLGIAMTLFSIVQIILTVAAAMHQAGIPKITGSVLSIIAFLIGYVSLLIALITSIEIIKAIGNPSRTLKELLLRIENLKERLRLEGGQ